MTAGSRFLQWFGTSKPLLARAVKVHNGLRTHEKHGLIGMMTSAETLQHYISQAVKEVDSAILEPPGNDQRNAGASTGNEQYAPTGTC